MNSLLSLADFEKAGRRHLPKSLHAYVSGGVEDNVTREANRASFDAWGFVPRVLVDISKRSCETELFGEHYALPVGIAPMGICALTAYRGDMVLARAASAERVPMIYSGSSLTRLEDIVAVARDAQTPRPWFQAYMPGDEAQGEALIARAQMAGYQTLVVTVDTPAPPNRENNVRAGFSTPMRPNLRLALDGLTHPRWLLGTLMRTLLTHGMPHFENERAERGAAVFSAQAVRDLSDRGVLNWRRLALIRRQWQGRLVVKGILNPQDARQAADAGADGIVVSNHGGRQLDGAVPSLMVLPEIVAACPDIVVMIDSGFRRGTDVLKALALGAKFVFIGRPFNYAAGLGGEAGVRRAISLLKAEINTNLAMLGLTHPAQITQEYLRPMPSK